LGDSLPQPPSRGAALAREHQSQLITPLGVTPAARGLLSPVLASLSPGGSAVTWRSSRPSAASRVPRSRAAAIGAALQPAINGNSTGPIRRRTAGTRRVVLGAHPTPPRLASSGLGPLRGLPLPLDRQPGGVGCPPRQRPTAVALSGRPLGLEDPADGAERHGEDCDAPLVEAESR
jgi:hypothetical protein